ncbi:MAG: ABC transporter ATP-binding protein [Oligella ureolytica]|uniref:ABC transporter ATP-binding protein n=1 Tax=Oligella ureolytica TaxID=90244 RepID=UPI000E0F77EE|nr:ABC transporter ATP-binding protein [Oligella ureolytica]NLP31928.1 ABC transporter ATP-binding protein [Oligella ureolytica]
MLKLENINSGYGAIQALYDVNLEINQGEIVTLIGSNGAGKTTTLMTICGNPRLRTGTISFEGEDISDLHTHMIMRKGIAISPEGRRVFPDLNVLENLKMGAFFLNREEIEAGVEHVFELFPRLKERAGQRSGLMSGGEQQMLAIGRALMSKPKMLLLDEPTLGLAPLIIEQIFEIIKTIRDEGITVFLVEQNANKALQIADRGYVLETGRIVLHDTGANLLLNDEVGKAYLGH